MTAIAEPAVAFLAAANLTVRFGTAIVIDSASLSIRPGELVAIIGPNGSGKTTLIRTLLGLLKPAGGAVERNAACGYLAQSPAYVPGQRVSEVMLSGRPSQRASFGIETRHDLEVVRDLAHTLELDELLRRPIESLSGGQRQRAFIGRALASEPQALLLDEPATFLDLRHQVELYQLLRALCRQKKLAVLMASHDLNLAAAHCDRIVVLNKGKIIADGAPREVLRAQMLSDVYGVPLNRVEIGGQVHIVPNV